MDTDTYKGVPLTKLTIDAVVWSEKRIEHLRTRTIRYNAGETNMEPEWANEAVMDEYRIVRVSGDSDETASLKVLGYSNSLDAVLKVWIWSDEPATSAIWNGGSAALANDSDVRRYEKLKEEDDG